MLDVFTFNLVIDCLCKLCQLARINTLLEGMKSWKIKPNFVTLNRKIEPNIVTLNILSSALCDKGRVNQAHNVLNTMINRQV